MLSPIFSLQMHWERTLNGEESGLITGNKRLKLYWQLIKIESLVNTN